MATTEEDVAQHFLNEAKMATKVALNGLDPNPTEPVATAMLAAIDALDVASRELSKRAK